jgi:hypothetical protein
MSATNPPAAGRPRYWLWIGLPIALVVLLLCANPWVSPWEVARNNRAATVAYIHLMLKTQQDAWNRGDLDAFMADYHMSDDTTFYGSTITTGWVAVKERYEKKYKAPGAQMGRLDFSDIQPDVLSADAVMVRGRWKTTVGEASNTGFFTLLVRKLPEGWKIVHDHTSEEKPTR